MCYKTTQKGVVNHVCTMFIAIEEDGVVKQLFTLHIGREVYKVQGLS